MAKVPEIFGSMVFNDQKMQERLPKSTYKALKKTIQNGEPLDLSVANVVAAAMKDWAVEMGCTHYTHWFQPMTGITAEKHDSFIAPNGEGQFVVPLVKAVQELNEKVEQKQAENDQLKAMLLELEKRIAKLEKNASN